MTVVELARLVVSMRTQQKTFFDPRTRTPDAFRASKKLERAVDRACEEVLGDDDRGQGTLFREGS